MEEGKEIFACVGPESTGKTMLCEELASHFNGVVVPEFSREYLTEKDGHYEECDLLIIAQKQLELENRIIAKANGSIFCDTDILVILIWHQFKYGKRNKEIEKLFDKQQPRNYLITYPDLEWIADPLRENPNDLLQLFKLYEMSLKTIGADYRIIKGQDEQRLTNAIEAVSSFTQRES
ncbi:MAG: ATP-binding protein [Flavobacteriales bacterium]|jgi:nicotinamide riboside kinase|nr:ATP-binding protein [Flavobacteriales bacterium]